MVNLLAAVECIRIAKESANRRPSYIKELVRGLKVFARDIGDIEIHRVTTETIESWVSQRAKSPGARATRISRLSTLFEFSRRRRWITENPCEFLERVSIDHPMPRILTLGEASLLIEACRTQRPRAFAWMILCLFAGLRPEEAEGMQWRDIDFSACQIFVPASISKTRRHRYVDPPGRCFDHLSRALQIGSELPLNHQAKRRAQRHLRGVLEWESWPKDVLRHTCASMWLAVEPNAPRISLQLGNSVSVLLRHYNCAVRKEVAEKFWCL